MATIQVSCRYCTSEQVIKNGSNKHDGHQLYRCQTCKRSFQLHYTYNAYQPTVKETIVQMTMNGCGIRDTARVLNIDPRTVLATLKKVPEIESVNPRFYPQSDLNIEIRVEADEQWSFVQNKKKQRWQEIS